MYICVIMDDKKSNSEYINVRVRRTTHEAVLRFKEDYPRYNIGGIFDEGALALIKSIKSKNKNHGKSKS